jgi:hypothetical protein
VRRTLFDPEVRRAVVDRIRGLAPETPRRWGRMTAPKVIVHLTDQMTHCLGDVPCRPVASVLRWAPLRYASIYLIPWPKGRVEGPPDAFVTRPGAWEGDVARLVALVERFGARDPGEAWPEHALFGRMRGRDWGFFCYKHFDHHLRQFGQ